MLTRIMAAGLMAGVISGLCVSALQHATTVPLILQAEVYEKAVEKTAIPEPSSWNVGGEPRIILAHNDTQAEAGQPGHGDAWQPADGLERTATTTVATIGAAVGFALMLLAAMIASGTEISARSATLWGLGAFVATGLAPGMGLPPELPGSAAGDLVMRQAWWVATAMATAAGIWLMFRTSGTPRIAAGIALIAAPHLIGAPHPGAFTSAVPAELAGHFTSTSLAVHAVLWVLVGASAGYFWQRFGRTEPLA